MSTIVSQTANPIKACNGKPHIIDRTQRFNLIDNETSGRTDYPDPTDLTWQEYIHTSSQGHDNLKSPFHFVTGWGDTFGWLFR